MLEDIATVHRYDQRGGGRSTGDPPFTVAQFVEDLDALREHWGHAAWVVGGHSWGAWLCLMYAMAHGSRLTAIIGLDMPPPANEGWRDSYQRVRDSRLSSSEQTFIEEIRQRRRSGEPISAEEERQWVHLNWRTDFAQPGATPDFDREPLFAFPANYAVNRALVEEMDGFAATRDVAASLGLIRAPAMFIHGTGDPRPAPESVIAALPNAYLRTVDDAGHLPWFEQPAIVADVLREFLRSVE
jgi:proline iminopeptidase